MPNNALLRFLVIDCHDFASAKSRNDELTLSYGGFCKKAKKLKLLIQTEIFR
ncbi:hypothetical protein [Helicobacter sp. T3_23-1056]